jgi:4-hydroxy-tetrahydrodipicolinate reductase
VHPVRVVVVGVGPLGKLVLEACVGRPDLQTVGATDVAPDVAGTVVHGVDVVDRLDRLPEADVAIHTATSRRAAATRTIRALLARGLSVVSSSEELHGDAALDAEARERGLRVVATGVNPGLVMDRLPALLVSACVRADAVRVTRVVDLSARRGALRKKMGVGLPEAALREKSDLGHVGLQESMATLLSAMGRTAETLDHSLEPIVHGGVGAGMDEKLVARSGGRDVAVLHLRMDMNARSLDTIEIDGDPPIRCAFEGGIQGDRATVGLLLSAAREVGRRKG